MRQSLEQVANILKKKNEHLAKLLEVMREARETIVSADAKRFGSTIRQVPKARRNLNSAVKELRELLPEVAAELGLSGDNITLSRIISCVEPEERSVLQPLKDELAAGFFELDELNMENQEYLYEHLDYSEAALNLMIQEEDPLNNFYGDDGNAAPEQKKSASIFERNA